MSELRWDPLDRTWALIASERGLRPTDFLPPPKNVDRKEPCPFCLIVEGQGQATRIAEKASDTMHDMADRAMEQGREAAHQMQNAASTVQSAVNQSLKQQPMATLAMAAAVGFVLGALWKS